MTINLIVCFIMVLILAACILSMLLIYRRLKESYDALRISHRNLEKLNSELRAQRHDYLNNLQVVYGLMELEEYEELHSFLEPIFKDLLKTGKALRTSKPAINALLKAKMGEAENRGIDFYIEVKSDLEGLQVEDWELCKVLANLLDNAMTALEGKEGERKILLDISEDSQQYRFSVCNNGPEIPISMREEIFKQGISTKKEEGHGMGLFIVMSVLKGYEGTMKLRSEEGETEFLFTLPKKKEDEGWNH
jgi:sensor histidine kinase regulating citrate/malate metabolism